MDELIQGILKRLQARFNPEEIGAYLATLFSNIMVGALTFLAFYGLWWVIDRFLKWFIHRTKVDETTASFIFTSFKFILLTLGIIQALSAVGINTAAMLTSLGIAGLTIGFAARDALSNLISGLLIFWDRPFVIGDLIELDGQYGRVERITLRSTRVVTVDGQMLAIPNSTIINSTVSSYTNFPNIRLDIDVTISVNEDIDLARKTLLALVKDNTEYLENPTPKVVVTSLNYYNIALQMQV